MSININLQTTNKKFLYIDLDADFISKKIVVEIYGKDRDCYYRIETTEEKILIPFESKQYFVKAIFHKECGNLIEKHEMYNDPKKDSKEDPKKDPKEDSKEQNKNKNVLDFDKILKIN